MTNFEALDADILHAVTGGQTAPAADPGGAPNRTSADMNVGVTARGVKVGVQAGVDVRRTDYATCIGAARQMGATAAQVPAMCGLPGGR